MNAERLFLAALNIVARVAGFLWILFGIAFVLMAFIAPHNRALYGVFGVLGVLGGAAFIIARSIKPSDLDRIRRFVRPNSQS